MMMTMPATIDSSADQVAHQRADDAGAGAERHEHGRESQNEHSRRHHHGAARERARLAGGDLLDGRARQVDEIGRHQRQHAGDRKLMMPATSAARMETSEAMGLDAT